VTDTFVTDRETGSDKPERAKKLYGRLSAGRTRSIGQKKKISDYMIVHARTGDFALYAKRLRLRQ